MKLTDSYLTSFIREEFPDFELVYKQTATFESHNIKDFRLRLTGRSGGKKLKIFSRYTPTQLGKELELGYKLVLKHEGGMIIIDLKKVSTIE